MELIEASKRGDIEQVTLLLEQGVDVNIKNEHGFTSLHLACWEKQLEIVKILLKAGANMSVQTEQGNAPLHIISWKEHPEIVKLLLEAGANTQIMNNDGQKPKNCTRNEEIRNLFEEYESIPDVKEPGCE